jgi:hypothetical protein
MLSFKEGNKEVRFSIYAVSDIHNYPIVTTYMVRAEGDIEYEFLDMVEAEYAKLTKCAGYNFSFSTNSSYLNNKGRVLKQDLNAQMVEYTVTITNNGKTESVTLGSIIEGTYNK